MNYPIGQSITLNSSHFQGASNSAISSLGLIIKSHMDYRSEALRKLITLLKNPNDKIVSESVVELTSILSDNKVNYKAIVIFCVKIINKLTNEKALCSIVWLVSKYSNVFPTISKELVRKLTKSYPTEGISVKILLISLALKIWLHDSNNGIDDQQHTKVVEILIKLCLCDKENSIRMLGTIAKSVFKLEKGNKQQSILNELSKLEMRRPENKSNHFMSAYSFLVFD